MHNNNKLEFPRPIDYFGGELNRSVLIEEKIDGWRMMIWKGYAYCRNDNSPNRWNQLPQSIQDLMTSVPVDGEIYWPEHPSTDIPTALNNRNSELIFVGFRIADENLLPHEHREKLIKLGISVPYLYSTDYVSNIDVEELLSIAEKRGLEGWVLKEKTIDNLWWKLKVTKTYDVIITGINYPSSGRNYENGWIKSLICSAHLNGIFTVIANVNGFSDDVRAGISSCDIGKVIEVSANGTTSKKMLRHSRFVRFRPDKNKYECKINNGEYDDLFSQTHQKTA